MTNGTPFTGGYEETSAKPREHKVVVSSFGDGLRTAEQCLGKLMFILILKYEFGNISCNNNI